MHQHRCHECGRAFTTAHFLDLHQSEWHDPFFDLQKQRQPMYRCFVVTCTTKMASRNERREHLIQAHHYPPSFPFADMVGKMKLSAQSPARAGKPPRQQAPNPPAVQASDGMDQDLDGVDEALESLVRRIPQTLSFG
ncbi:uncharacterized protein MONBRDRAFT_18478, partial [Monosiga brevicollis MX1]